MLLLDYKFAHRYTQVELFCLPSKAKAKHQASLKVYKVFSAMNATTTCFIKIN